MLPAPTICFCLPSKLLAQDSAPLPHCHRCPRLFHRKVVKFKARISHSDDVLSLLYLELFFGGGKGKKAVSVETVIVSWLCKEEKYSEFAFMRYSSSKTLQRGRKKTEKCHTCCSTPTCRCITCGSRAQCTQGRGRCLWEAKSQGISVQSG